MAIHINPAHKGRLHADLGVKKGKKLTAAEIDKAKHSSDPAERKRATFAANARKWNKGKSNGEKDARRATKLYGGKSK